jgi:AraC-like DNA-binding protein
MEAFYESERDMEEGEFWLDDFNDLNFPPHLHYSFELLFLLDGSMNITVEGQKEEMRKGDIAIVPPGDIHSFETQLTSKGTLMFFPVEYCSDLRQIFGKRTIASHVAHMPNSGIEQLKEKYELNRNLPFSPLLFKGYINALFYEAIEKLTLIDKKNDISHDLLKKILILIREQYDNGINLNETAKAVGLSRSYVSRFFKKAIGYGFNEYINQLRVEKSKGLLAARNQDILDVALECGFDNQRSFDRIFKKHVNMTPSEYQKKC